MSEAFIMFSFYFNHPLYRTALRRVLARGDFDSPVMVRFRGCGFPAFGDKIKLRFISDSASHSLRPQTSHTQQGKSGTVINSSSIQVK